MYAIAIIMIRTLLAILLLLCSLFTVLPIPARQLWYLGIAVPEFPWVWIAAGLILLCWSLVKRRLRALNALLCIASVGLFCRPIVGAIQVGQGLDKGLRSAFGEGALNVPGPHRNSPFAIGQMFSGLGTRQMPHDSLRFTGPGQGNLSLNYYPPGLPGIRPCLLVVRRLLEER